MPLLDMFPRQTIQDGVDGALDDAKPPGKRSMRVRACGMQSSYLPDIVLGQLGSGRAYTLRGVCSTLGKHVDHVLALGSKEQVIRAHTGWVVAAVTYGQSGRNVSEVDHPRYTVRFPGGAVEVQRAIPVSVRRPCPLPARTFTAKNLRPESRFIRLLCKLGMHFWSLLCRFRGAVPRAVAAAPGRFACPHYTAVPGNGGMEA